MTISKEQIERGEKLCREAPPGEWFGQFQDEVSHQPGGEFEPVEQICLIDTHVEMSSVEREATANFIAHHNPQTLLKLYATLREAISIIEALNTNPHINLSDQVYIVREREGLGWDGPAVKAWEDAVNNAQVFLSKMEGGK